MTGNEYLKFEYNTRVNLIDLIQKQNNNSQINSCLINIDEISPLSALSNILPSAISPESDKSAENLGIKNNGLLQNI